MHEMFKRYVPAVAGLALAAVTGCQSAWSETSSPGMQVGGIQQFIVKFKAGTFACDAADIARFAKASRIPVEFVRPMSGDACIVRPPSLHPSAAPEMQQQLKSHPAVEWVEIDRIMKAFQ